MPRGQELTTRGSIAKAYLVALSVGLVGFGTASQAGAALVATMYVQTTTVTPYHAIFDVSLDFPGVAGDDRIEAIQLSTWGSDPHLTSGDTDFSRFSFAIDDTTLPGWVELESFAAGNLYLCGPADPGVGPVLGPNPGPPHHLGELIVDVSDLPQGMDSYITLAGSTPGRLTDLAGGVAGTIAVGSFRRDEGPNDPADLAFGQDTVGFRTFVPEPLTLLTTLLGAGAVLLRLRRRCSPCAK
jgi:hypothetical protein